MESNLLKAQEVAKILRLPKSSVYELARKNALPGIVKIGRRYRFRENDIRAYAYGETAAAVA